MSAYWNNINCGFYVEYLYKRVEIYEQDRCGIVTQTATNYITDFRTKNYNFPFRDEFY